MKKLVFSPSRLHKGLLLAGMIAFTMSDLIAQGTAGSVSSALSSADTEVRASFQPVSRIMLAVMAIVGVVGAIQVYGKWSNGDPDTRKSAASWFGALIFAGLVLLVIRAVFGVS